MSGLETAPKIKIQQHRISLQDRKSMIVEMMIPVLVSIGGTLFIGYIVSHNGSKARVRTGDGIHEVDIENIRPYKDPRPGE